MLVVEAVDVLHAGGMIGGASNSCPLSHDENLLKPKSVVSTTSYSMLEVSNVLIRWQPSGGVVERGGSFGGVETARRIAFLDVIGAPNNRPRSRAHVFAYEISSCTFIRANWAR